MSKNRQSEHQQFLDWLIQTIKEVSIDCLVIAGDIFDTYTPPNYALSLYYNFLKKIPTTTCKNVVIVGGNHDSISTLHAPKDLLKLFNIHIVAGVSEPEDRNPIVLKDGETPLAIVCPVPFLRDRDIRTSLPGETYDEKSQAYAKAVIGYYETISEKAVQLKEQLTPSIPIIGTGHFFTLGGSTTDSVRDIFVGNLGQINAAHLPAAFDYMALGHLHRAQTVKGYEQFQYSGSPIPLSFSELKEEKVVHVVDFKEGHSPDISSINVPEFKKLICLKGDLEQIESDLKQIDWAPYHNDPAWLEIQYKSDQWMADLQVEMDQLTKDLPVEILAIKSSISTTQQFQAEEALKTLEEISPLDVFEKRLACEEISAEEKKNLTHLFNDILNSVYNRSKSETHEN